MARKMVIVKADRNEHPVLTEVEAHDEAQLQQRLTENPDIIPIEEFGWSGPLMVVSRESSLPPGSPDLIGIARGGEILVAEFKTGPANPDFRGALAQAMDYGAAIWGLTVEEFEDQVARPYFAGKHCPPHAPTINAKSLKEAADATWGTQWDAEDRDQFRDRVERGLQGGHFHFAVVAQRFTAAMERTAHYLNNTSIGAGVYLVELIRFTSTDDGLDAFEARTVLKPDRGRRSRDGGSPKAVLDEEAFIAREPDPERQTWLREFFEFCAGIGLTIEWGKGGVSIRVQTGDRPEPLSIGWLFPSGASGWLGLTGLTLGFDRGSAEQTPSIRDSLDQYVARLAELPGAVKVKPRNLTAYGFDHPGEVANSAAVRELLSTLTQEAAHT